MRKQSEMKKSAFVPSFSMDFILCRSLLLFICNTKLFEANRVTLVNGNRGFLFLFRIFDFVFITLKCFTLNFLFFIHQFVFFFCFYWILYEYLGTETTMDSCCRTHDLCPIKIRAYEAKYNITNNSLYTK